MDIGHFVFIGRLNLKKYQNKLGIPQVVLSKKANFAFYTIAKIEFEATPNPTFEPVKLIADQLNVSLNALMR